MNKLSLSLLLTTAAMIFPATGVHAQETGASDKDDSAEVGDIVVTGTRLGADGTKAPTPVTTVSAELLTRASPGNLADAINQLPQLANSSSQTSYIQTNADGAFNGNYLNLRGIGTARALILFDGLRAVQTNSQGGVDVNTLPQILVKRVDIVTAGASAAYGSDAVSGVINYVLDRDFNGLKYEANSGVSTYGDAPSFRLAGAFGTSFADDRGHFLFSAEHYEQKAIESRAARPNGAALYTLAGSATTSDPLRTIANARVNFASFGGLIPALGMTFKNGALAPFDAATPVGTSGFSIGGDGAHFNDLGLTGSIDTTQLFGRTSYDFGDTLSAFVQASFARAKNKSQYGNDFRFGGLLISPDNPFLSSQDQALLAGVNAGGPVVMSRYNRDLGARYSSAVNTNYAITGGLEGEIRGFSWNVSYQHARNELKVEANEFDNRRFFAALDATKDGAGNIVCRVTLTNPGLYPGCQPLNLFGENAASATAASWVRGTSRFNIVNTMDDVTAGISGKPFMLPAGPVSIALGVEYRRQSLRQTSNSDPAVPVDFTAIQNVPAATPAFDWTNVASAVGSYTVKEAFGEIDVPIFADSALGKSLNLNGAVRLTDYSTSGSVVTWKAGLVYEPTSDLRIRATQSHDIRAPTLYNLVASESVNQNAVTTPAGSVNVNMIQAGNPLLRPEKADTTSIGFVYSPEWVRGAHVSVDFYQLKLKDAITTADAQSTYNDCAASNGTSPTCALISFASDGVTPTTIRQVPINSASLLTRGIDIDGSYRTSAGEGSVTFRALANFVPNLKLRSGANSVEEELAGTANTSVDGGQAGYPKWRGSFSINYERQGLNIYVQERWIGKFKRSTRSTYVIEDKSNMIPNVFYTDVTVSHDVAEGRIQPYLSINNLFNRQAPLYASYFPGVVYPAAQSIHNIMGRYLTVGVRGKF